jgi:hypothetical protein
MVNIGTGHDRCPFSFPGPIRRPGAISRRRFRNYKTCFWFQEGLKKISTTMRSLLARLP